jgi:hypothetical protein
MQPQWRYVPFASALLIGSGLFMLLHGASAQPVRPFSHSHACESASAPTSSGPMPRTPSGEHLGLPDDRRDAAKVSIAPSTQGTADTGRSDDVIEADTARWPPPRSAVLLLRGLPCGDDDARGTHHLDAPPQ